MIKSFMTQNMFVILKKLVIFENICLKLEKQLIPKRIYKK